MYHDPISHVLCADPVLWISALLPYSAIVGGKQDVYGGSCGGDSGEFQVMSVKTSHLVACIIYGDFQLFTLPTVKLSFLLSNLGRA